MGLYTIFYVIDDKIYRHLGGGVHFVHVPRYLEVSCNLGIECFAVEE